MGSRLHHNDSFKTVAIHSDLNYQHWFVDSAPGAESAETRFADMLADPGQFRSRLAALCR